MSRRLALNTAIVGGAFVLSRILGLVRDVVIGAQFGTSAQKDIYDAAFRIPDTLFLLIIGGAVGSAFIPVFTGLTGKGKIEEGWRLASTLINVSVVLLSVGGIVLSLAAPVLVGLIILPGRPPEQQETAAHLTRIMLFSPLFLGLGGWAMGILNAHRHFTLPALAPVFYNLSIIGGAIFLVPLFGVEGLAWGVVAGALLHFGVQLPGLRGVGMRYAPRINLRDEGASEVGKLVLPRILGQSAFQINAIATTSIASFLPDGRISALNYAFLLMLLPHGVFALSLATVTFPTMASQYAEGDVDGVRATLARAVRVLLFLTLPSAVGLFVLREEIVAAIFELGSFTQVSTALVSSALAYFALGLVAYAVVEVVTRGFYALHDTATPVVVSVVTVLLNIGFSLLLVRVFGWGHEGLALSLAATTTLEMVLLWLFLGRKLPKWGLGTEGLIVSIARSGAAAAAMGAALFVALPALHAWLDGQLERKLAAALLAAVGVGLGAGVYIGVAVLLRSEEVREAVGLLLRRSRKG